MHCKINSGADFMPLMLVKRDPDSVDQYIQQFLTSQCLGSSSSSCGFCIGDPKLVNP